MLQLVQNRLLNLFSAYIVLLKAEMPSRQKVYFQTNKLIRKCKLMKKINRMKLKKFMKNKNS
jgi:hypothetical protein